MAVHVPCPKCKTVLSFPDNPQVTAGRCPRCQTIVSPSPPVAVPVLEPAPEQLPQAQPVEVPAPARPDRQGLTDQPVPAPAKPAKQHFRSPHPGRRDDGDRASHPPRTWSPVLLVCVIGVPVLLGLLALTFVVASWDQKSTSSLSERDGIRDMAPERRKAEDASERRVDKGGNGEGGRPTPLLRMPARPDPVAIVPPANPPASVRLPAIATAVEVGGGGRFLVFHFDSLNKLGIFDVNKLEVIHTIHAETGVHFAAGMTALALHRPATQELENWNLLTGKLECTARVSFLGPVKQLCLGSASAGPLLVATKGKGEFDGKTRFFDLETLRPLEEGERSVGGRYVTLEAGRFWASADGRVFGSSGDHSGRPLGIWSYQLAGGKVQRFSLHDTASFVYPGPDGQYVYLGGYGVMTNRLETTTDAVYSGKSGHLYYSFLPAHWGPYYLHVHRRSLPSTTTRPLNPDDPDLGLTVYLLGTRQPLLQIPNAGLTPFKVGDTSPTILPLEKTVHLIPRAKLLVVIPAECDRLALYPVDLEAALTKLKSDYLVMTSDPPATARPGQEFRYTMTASSSGKVNYTLESGPEGMKVTPQGELIWAVPAEAGTSPVEVLVRARSDKGAQALHRFTLTLGPAGSP